MPNSRWSTLKLGDAGEWLSGGTPSKVESDLWSGLIPWVSPKDMKRPRIGDAEDHVHESAIGNGTRLVPPSTLLMVVRGMILAHTFPVAMTTQSVAFNQDIKALIPSKEFLPEFLLYWLQDSQRDVLQLVDIANHGTKRLATERLFALDLPCPPLPEQKKIAAILSSVDETIAKTEAVIAQLQIVKKAMMEQLLTKGMPGRHTRFKQTEIGEIPEEWEVVELGVVTTRITKGESPNWQGFAYQDQGTVFVTSENVRDGFLLLDPLKFVPIEFANKVRRSRLASGDILVNLVGASIGRACIWSGEFLDANVNQAVAVISPEKTLVHSRWILEMLYTAHGQRYFGLSKVDSARPNVSLANLREFPLPLPSLAEQSEIVGIAASLVESMRLEERALKCLQSLKTALSSSLLSGELRVIPEVAE